jgi:beta-glucosidase
MKIITQWGNDSRYTKVIGALKHYTIYSVEDSGTTQGASSGDVRGASYFPISLRDVEETYLPAFKAPVVEANSLGYMCSYAALTNPAINSDSATHPHSEPCCASRFFAITKMEQEYGFRGYVQSDCGAVGNEVGREGYAANATDAAAKAVVDGRMNSNCGGGLNAACAAVAAGLLPQAELEARVTRSFTLLMDAGLFDPLERQTYTKVGACA